MIALAIFAIALCADLWTTDRALRRHPNAVEGHPLLSRVFSERARRSQFAIWAVTQSAAFWGVFVYWAGAPIEIMLAPAAWHLWAAAMNYRQEKKQ